MFTKSTFTLDFVLTTTSVVLAAMMASATPSFAGYVKRFVSQDPAPFATTGPVRPTPPVGDRHGCSIQVTFPQCSEGRGNLD
jgi:hypothetical protein